MRARAARSAFAHLPTGELRRDRSGDGNDERIVAHTRHGGAPRWQIRQGVGPAEADDAGFGRLPPRAAAAHPGIGVRERDAAYPVNARERDGAFHAGMRVQIADAPLSVPTLEGA